MSHKIRLILKKVEIIKNEHGEALETLTKHETLDFDINPGLYNYHPLFEGKAESKYAIVSAEII